MFFRLKKQAIKIALLVFRSLYLTPIKTIEIHEALETALSLHAAGNHVQALKLLQKAFISNRVQEGFYNETQVALQKAMIEIEKGQGNWKKRR